MCGVTKRLFFCLTIGALYIYLFLASCSWARVSGVCSNCHTMHYSQGSQILLEWGKTGPYKALVINDCLGCHTGTNTGNNTTPYVFDTSEPSYGDFGITGSTLAGGNFYWVGNGTDDTLGHNVMCLGNPDDTFGNVPPGGVALSGNLTCAGANGCHGDRTITGNFESILGAHHADDSVIDGTTVGTSFRFLKGIKGIEDSDWEYQPTASAHNQYYALSGTLDTASINYLCCECHGNFHDSTGASPWFRHPTDFALSDASGSGYTNYPGSVDASYPTGTYFPGVPLGSDLVGGVISTVTFSGTDDIVLCISCHRAHGSPYKKLMRWDYYGWPETSSINGCSACHTIKD